MIVCTDANKRPPSILPLSDDEHIRSLVERLARDNRSVDDFMERLTKFIEDVHPSNVRH
jgi:hypothetical protein